MQNRKLEILPYHPDWPTHYKNEIQKIKNALGTKFISAHHIGSTAIPGMAAKPVIDISLEYQDHRDIPHIIQQLEKLNYGDVHRNLMPHLSYFMHRQDQQLRFHMHIYPVGDPQLQRHMNFRDYLCHHSDDAIAYMNLKKRLAQMPGITMPQYVIGKDKFVKTIDAKARKWPGRNKQFPFTHYKLTASASNQEILAALEANFVLHMTYYAQFLPEVELIRVPGYASVNSGLQDDYFNYVVDIHLNEQDVEQKVEDITEYFAKRQVPFSWWISPHDSPQHLAAQLIKNDCALAGTTIAMYINLANWNATTQKSKSQLQIMRALDHSSLQDFASVRMNNQTTFTTYFSWLADTITAEDPIEYYVGYANGQAVVSSILCCYGGVAGIYCISVTPHVNEEEYVKQMQLFALQRAQQLGYPFAVLQSATNTVSFYERLSYKSCGKFFKYTRSA